MSTLSRNVVYNVIGQALLTRRMGKPDDVARVIAYLISPLSSQVTAAEWIVDGGALPQI